MAKMLNILCRVLAAFVAWIVPACAGKASSSSTPIMGAAVGAGIAAFAALGPAAQPDDLGELVGTSSGEAFIVDAETTGIVHIKAPLASGSQASLTNDPWPTISKRQ